MKLMNHERLIVAKSYIEQALKVIEDFDGGNGMYDEEVLHSVAMSCRRASDIATLKDDDQ